MKEKTKNYLIELLMVVMIAVLVFSVLQCTASMKPNKSKDKAVPYVDSVNTPEPHRLPPPEPKTTENETNIMS